VNGVITYVLPPTHLNTIGACNTRVIASIVRQWLSPCIDIYCSEYADMKG